MKDADVFFTIPANVPFWTSGQFEPLIVAIILPHSHVPSYTGPWVVKGTDVGQRVEQALRRGFKCGSQEELDGNDAGELHDLEGKLCDVWERGKSGERVTDCSAATTCLGEQVSPCAGMYGVENVIGKQATIGSHGWTTEWKQ